MEVESATSVDATSTAETDVAAQSEAEQAAAPNDNDPTLSSKSAVESDAFDAVSAATPTRNNNSWTTEFYNQASSPSAARDGEADEPQRPGNAGDVCPSETTSDFSVQPGSSFDPSTQRSSTADINAAHPASPVLLENDGQTFTTTSTTEMQRNDDKLHSAAEIIEEPSPSCNSEHQEPDQQQQQPEQLPNEEDLQIQDFKAGSYLTVF